MQEVPEQEILKSIGNPKTLNKGYRLLVDQYQERIYWQVRKMVICHDDTHDVVQNVFVKVYRGISKFKGESKLSTWLFRIAYNESITFLNQKARKLKITNEELSSRLVEGLESDVYFTSSEVEIALQKALAQLPDRQKEIFNMRYYDEIKFKDIAEILNLTEGAVKSSYHIAAKKIESFIREN
jgi:RNA polymerase sigma-70 factor (ECF subfamily)